ncbi:unnamed protein product [Somion occarium]|uniref:Uncharacterized protein n=1 Tax=Somion occarium TaxID=3059160 RepID=A0ABP1CMR8_9APHY
MAVLAPQDWHPPRDHTMDAPSPNSSNSSIPRQRSSPANDHSASTSPLPPQQPYPYPVQQQQAGWTPAQQQQFYPAFYQNPQPYGIHGSPHSPPGQLQSPYYDPANAQFAQWAYQQMMFNAHQAHQLSHVPSPMSGQRNRAGSASAGGDYFPPGQMANYNLFPSGTPPPHPSQLPNGYPAGQGDQQQSQYGGFHPYRRPNRQGSHNQDTQQPPADWRPGMQQFTPASIQPPYVRADASGSSTSVNSNSAVSNGTRPRTNSNQGSSAGGGSGAGSPSSHSHGKAVATNGHGRIGSGNSTASSTPSIPPQRPHTRTNSSSSNTSSSTAPRSSSGSSATAPTTTTTSSHPPVNLRKPSPLSQDTFTAAEKRMSRDDSDLTAMLEPAPGVRSGGLKGRLRRALSLNAGAALQEEPEEDTPVKGKSIARHVPTTSTGASSHPALADDDESTATVQKKKSRSLFNSRLNRSTDNISLSSTMSSASMVIRKLGSIGKLTRRNSLAGITSLFKDKKDKDKDKDKEVEDADASGKKGKKKKGEKSSASEASVSHATAEFDRGDWTVDMPSGLSPAAMLARQHTLKSNAEAAARAKAEQEAKAAAAAAAQHNASGDPVPATWEKNTTNRQGENLPARMTRVNEDGMRVVVEDDDSDSDDGHSDDHHHASQNYSMDGWDDDEDWEGPHDDEDITIRAALDNAALDDEEMEPWAINVRRSIERVRRPTKGILKTRPDGTGYEQDAYLPHPNPSFTRNRSNSYDSPSTQGQASSSLAHIPSPNPDQIDGLAKHHNSSNGQSSTSFIPPLSFETGGPDTESPKDISDTSSQHTVTTERSLFNHPNSSAPALSRMFSANPPTLTTRSATAPAKRLAFATNLSVYDTFPATVYDRRSEPATWSRLTPALAQRIKEELNSYKMEEMEVHSSSRVHTQFFV